MSCLAPPKKGKLRKKGADDNLRNRSKDLEEVPSRFVIVDYSKAPKNDTTTSSPHNSPTARHHAISSPRRISITRLSARGPRPLEIMHDPNHEDIGGFQPHQEIDLQSTARQQSISRDDDHSDDQSDIARPSTPPLYDPYAYHTPTPLSPILEDVDREGSQVSRPDNKEVVRVDEELPLLSDYSSECARPIPDCNDFESSVSESDSEDVSETRSNFYRKRVYNIYTGQSFLPKATAQPIDSPTGIRRSPGFPGTPGFGLNDLAERSAERVDRPKYKEYEVLLDGRRSPTPSSTFSLQPTKLSGPFLENPERLPRLKGPWCCCNVCEDLTRFADDRESGGVHPRKWHSTTDLIDLAKLCELAQQIQRKRGLARLVATWRLGSTIRTMQKFNTDEDVARVIAVCELKIKSPSTVCAERGIMKGNVIIDHCPMSGLLLVPPAGVIYGGVLREIYRSDREKQAVLEKKVEEELNRPMGQDQLIAQRSKRDTRSYNCQSINQRSFPEFLEWLDSADCGDDEAECETAWRFNNVGTIGSIRNAFCKHEAMVGRSQKANYHIIVGLSKLSENLKLSDNHSKSTVSADILYQRQRFQQ